MGRARAGGIAAVIAVVLVGCGDPPSSTVDGAADPCSLPDTRGVSGVVSDGIGPIAGARVTLVGVVPDGVRETRSGADGRYAIAGVPPGSYALGASARDRAYVEQAVTVADGCVTADVTLGTETAAGSWENLGDPGERLGGTNSGVLLPDGRLMYCHNTLDPVIVDPVSEDRDFVEGSPRLQGCHAVTLMPDGRVIYVGGTDQPVYGPGTRQVKTFDPETETWDVQDEELTDWRWYPTMVPLPDGALLVVGGGGLENPLRVNSSETMDPSDMSWSVAGDIALGNEVSPVVLLSTGEVLMTHRPPQLYDPAERTWRLAGDFVQGDRMANGDHADHELILLPDGRVAAIGFKSFTEDPGAFLELYDPEDDAWTLGASTAPVRSRASAVILPDGRVLALGGFKEDETDPTPVNAWGQVALADLYDPERDVWRRLTPMELAREYHATPILVPDGRVFMVGGEGVPGSEPDASVLEAFSPPYLARGPRPEIAELDSTDLVRGGELRLRFAGTAAPTQVILMGTSANTHFMDSGNMRFLDLSFELELDGAALVAQIPTAPALAVFGYYMLFVMVDDIPSVGRIVRITE
jgi:hypothetical protein